MVEVISLFRIRRRLMADFIAGYKSKKTDTRTEIKDSCLSE